MALVLRSGVQDKRHAYISLIAAEYCGVQVEQENSVGENPVLETTDGPVFESYSMARYIAKFKGDNTLLGSSIYENVSPSRGMDGVCCQGNRDGPKNMDLPKDGFGSLRPSSLFESAHWLCAAMPPRPKHSSHHKHKLFSRKRYNLADIAMTCTLHFGFTCVMTKRFTSRFPHVERYFWNLVGQPNFKKILGEVKQTESMLLEWPGPTIVPMVVVDPEWIVAQKNQKVNHMEAHKETVIIGAVP